MSATWRGDDRSFKFDKNLNNIFLNQIDGSAGEVIGQEDCLMMNIYSPNLTPETPLPVMVWKKAKEKPQPEISYRQVWIHGGGLITGSNIAAFYGASPYIDRHSMFPFLRQN